MIYHLRLNSPWVMKQPENKIEISVNTPTSVFTELIAHHIIEDPFYGLREHEVTWVYKADWVFEMLVKLDMQILNRKYILLRFYGIDTFGTILWNDQEIGITENMHRTYDFLIKSPTNLGMVQSENILKIKIASATKRALEECKTHNYTLSTPNPALPGIPYIRKAQYSFGWDWGPQLPDIGIWRPVEIIAFDGIRIENIEVHQSHQYNHDPSSILESQITYDQLCITSTMLTIKPEIRIEAIEDTEKRKFALEIILTDPQKKIIHQEKRPLPVFEKEPSFKINVVKPELWWSFELGIPLQYTILAILTYDGQKIEEKSQKLGIRELKLIRTPDKWGETFYFRLNGIPIFAKGANWVPIECFIPRGQQNRFYSRLLRDVKAANMSCLRVWGGGIYEDDEFYNLCDDLGIIIWQDFLFACAPYPAHEAFFKNVELEAIDNIKRLRHHACLAIWVGNNENEEGWCYWGWSIKHPIELKNAYLRLFEQLLPSIVKKYDPDRSYWPSSPSSGGNFKDPRSEDRGDSHFWKPWQKVNPLSIYRDNFSRFNSEFGFESFPAFSTIQTFCPSDQMKFNSPVMLNHQKSRGGNQKIMAYMKKHFSIPPKFEHQIILSQIMQAEVMEYGVEHWRRNRNENHCMGTLYWQYNDCWPVASWSSVDYFGRWKALHYFTKRFYQPLFASVVESTNKVEIWVTNDRFTASSCRLKWIIVHPNGQICLEGEKKLTIEGCYAKSVEIIDVKRINRFRMARKNLIFFWLYDQADNLIGKNVRLFEAPKYLELHNPQISWDLDLISTTAEHQNVELKVNTKEIALYIYVYADSLDFIASDNFFSLMKGETYRIQLQIPKTTTLERLKSILKIESLYSWIKS